MVPIQLKLSTNYVTSTPGDILCAALATCLDSTIRLIANRLGVSLEKLEVDVSANVDLRGTLAVDRKVPVGFQSMECEINIKGEKGTDPTQIKRLLKATEYSCVSFKRYDLVCL